MQVEKLILDATAGYRKMHYDKNNPLVLYVDERSEVNPDVVADFRHLSFIPSKSKKLVIIDPPHLLDRWQPDKNSVFAKKYGLLKAETWQSDLRQGLLECWRVLDDFGTLLFKWSNHDKSVDDIIANLPFKPVIAEETKANLLSKHPNNKNSRYGANTTVWFVFFKAPSFNP